MGRDDPYLGERRRNGQVDYLGGGTHCEGEAGPGPVDTIPASDSWSESNSNGSGSGSGSGYGYGNGNNRNAPLARRLDPEGAWLGLGSSRSQARHVQQRQQQNVTKDSGADAGRPHCCCTTTLARIGGGGGGGGGAATGCARSMAPLSPDVRSQDACEGKSECHQLPDGRVPG